MTCCNYDEHHELVLMKLKPQNIFDDVLGVEKMIRERTGNDEVLLDQTNGYIIPNTNELSHVCIGCLFAEYYEVEPINTTQGFFSSCPSDNDFKREYISGYEKLVERAGFRSLGEMNNFINNNPHVWVYGDHSEYIEPFGSNTDAYKEYDNSPRIPSDVPLSAWWHFAENVKFYQDFLKEAVKND